MTRKKIQEDRDLINQEDFSFEDVLSRNPFILIIARYDDHLGPIPLYSSYNIKNNAFLKDITRASLTIDTKSIDFDKEEYESFKIQAWKIEIKSTNDRGGSQLFAIILLRSKKFLDLIPPSFFHIMEEKFRLIGNDKILNNDNQSFLLFSQKMINFYHNKLKNEIPLPLENLYKTIRDHINGIKGFSEFNRDQVKTLSLEDLIEFFNDTVYSCDKIIEILEKPLSISHKIDNA